MNNRIDHDHRDVKSRTGLMLGFQNFDCAAIMLAGVERLHRIRRNLFVMGRLRIKDPTPSAIRHAMPAA